MAYSYAQLKALWINNGGNPAAADIAAAVALAESGGSPDAKNVNTNGSIDRGLWQINSVHGSQSTFDPIANVKAAINISGNGKSWSPWVTFQTGAYKKFLSPTTSASSAGTPTASTAGLTIPGLGGGISVSGVTSGIINTVLGMLGIKGGLQDMFERLGLIILGFALVIMGIHLLSGGGSNKSSSVTVNEPSSRSGSSSTSKSRSREEIKSTTKKTGSEAGKGLSSEAIEAAAVALWHTSTRSVEVSRSAGSMKVWTSQGPDHCTPWVAVPSKALQNPAGPEQTTYFCIWMTISMSTMPRTYNLTCIRANGSMRVT